MEYSTTKFAAKWDQAGERLYETGVNRGMLYKYNKAATGTTKYDHGYAWNGLTGVTESPSGAEATALYADNIKYLNLMSAEELGATIEAYMYPEEFAECDGSAYAAAGVKIGQQTRKLFGTSYTTRLGNDEEGDAHDYKIHILYNCLASPSERAYATVNDSPEAITFSWEVTTTPVDVAGFKPTASMEIIASACDPVKLALLEAKLYGVSADTTAFSATSKYAVGDLVKESNKYYVCNTTIDTPAAFDADDWTEITDALEYGVLPMPDEIISMLS